jgi:glycoside/pentoside/hexuronide:cation symporter, GPH family
MVTPATSPTPPGDRLSLGERIGYGVGDTASNFIFQTFNIFLLYYYTDVLGIAAATAAAIFSVKGVISWFTDPVMGVICDRTKSKHGKFRPYLLWMAVPYGVVGYLVFANFPLSDQGKVIYAFAAAIAMVLVYTAINIPYSALVGVMSPSSSERTTLSQFRFICAFIGGFLITSMFSPLKNALGGGDEAVGFKWTMAIFAAVSVALFLFTFAATKERVLPAKDDKGANLTADIGYLFKNKPWVLLFIGSLATLAMTGLRVGSIVWFFKYYVGSGAEKVFLWFDQVSLFLTVGMLALIAGVASTKFFEQLWGKRGLMMVMVTGNALCMAAFFFVRQDQIELMYALRVLECFILGPTIPVLWSMYGDVADYGEWKFHRRTTGLTFAGALFSHKIGLTLGGTLPGLVAAHYGFVANAVQTPDALFGIRLVSSLMPAAFALVLTVVLFFYPITEETVKTMGQELARRREASEVFGPIPATP